MSDNSSDYHLRAEDVGFHHSDTDHGSENENNNEQRHAQYEEGGEEIEAVSSNEKDEEEEEEQDEGESGRRSATRPPEEEEAAQEAEEGYDPESLNNEDAPAPAAPLPPSAVTPTLTATTPTTLGTTATGAGAHTIERRRSSAYAGVSTGAGGTSTVSPGRSSYRVQRSASVHSGRGTGLSIDGRHITKENHNSLVPDERVQELRRQSILSAARHHSARRAGAVTGSVGVAGGGNRSARSASRGGGRRLSEAESAALAVIAERDSRRIDAYTRAQELNLERDWTILDQEIEKQRRAEDRYIRLLNERNKHIRESHVAREKRQLEAWKRRDALEEERRLATEASISRKDEVSALDPYGTFYSQMRYAARTPVRRSGGHHAIAPQRRASDCDRDQQIHSQRNLATRSSNGSGFDRKEANLTSASVVCGADAQERSDFRRAATPRPPSVAGRRRSSSAASIVQHPRGWH